MIRNITIRGFKRFLEASINLGALTILTGMNGSGKTTVIHSLLIMREAQTRRDEFVQLNGPFGLELGNFDDVMNYEADGSFELELQRSHGIYQRFRFSGEASQRYARVVEIDASGAVFDSQPRDFAYLSADRLGPRISQSAASLPRDLLEVGCRGEFTAQVLHELGNFTVDPKRIDHQHENLPPLLKSQTENWLSRITRPVQLDTENYLNTSSFSLKFRTGEEWIKPTNMGFGISYSLPILVSALIAPPNSMLVVENPEAHLHPAGQSLIGSFLAMVASSGVQVIIETHSDHVINGIRRAIGERKVLSHEHALAYYFSDSDQDNIHKISFTQNGGIYDYPKGFLDQYQQDIAAITRIRRPR